jgi:hypothetical protein
VGTAAPVLGQFAAPRFGRLAARPVPQQPAQRRVAVPFDGEDVVDDVVVRHANQIRIGVTRAAERVERQVQQLVGDAEHQVRERCRGEHLRVDER